jgi:hypothetical protein
LARSLQWVKGVAANLWHKATHFRCSPKATVGSRNVARS